MPKIIKKHHSFDNESKRKRERESIKRQALDRIKKIHPKIHRIRLSGEYSYDALKKRIGNIKVDPANRTMLNYYDSTGYIQTKDGRLTVYYNSQKGYFPDCRIETSNSNPKLLGKLNSALPKLTISSVEYTVDFFCYTPDDVANLFYLFVKYMYLPAQRGKTTWKGGKFEGLGEPRQENAVWYIGKDVKVYERGPNDKGKVVLKNKQKIKIWRYKRVNRVRLEFTLYKGNGHNQLLINHGIERLNDFLKNPKFEEIIFNKIKFSRFDGRSSHLPKEWDDYNSARNDKEYKIECFQDEVIKNRGSGVVKNIRQHITDADGFEDLKKRLRIKMRKFDKSWSNLYEKYQ